jgi:hypothetical protein
LVGLVTQALDGKPSEYIITAAHCGSAGSQSTVIFGESESSPSVGTCTARISPKSGFNPNTLPTNDIALGKLNCDPKVFSKLTCFNLPKEGQKPPQDATFTLVGWGRDESGGRGVGEMGTNQAAQYGRSWLFKRENGVGNDQTYTYDESFLDDMEEFHTAAPDISHTQVLPGDSGGPAITGRTIWGIVQSAVGGLEVGARYIWLGHPGVRKWILAGMGEKEAVDCDKVSTEQIIDAAARELNVDKLDLTVSESSKEPGSRKDTTIFVRKLTAGGNSTTWTMELSNDDCREYSSARQKP